MATVMMPNIHRGPHGPAQMNFTPTMHIGKPQIGNRNPLSLTKLPTAPPLLNNAIQRPPTMKVRGKENFNARIVPRPQPAPSTDSMYPKQGYARGQQKGLAFMKMNRPIDGPIMPIADSNFAWTDSRLGKKNKQ